VSGKSRRSRNVAITVAALLAGGGIVYGSTSRHHYDYNAVCADQRTDSRASDFQCENPSYYGGSALSPYHWYYIPTNQGAYVPGVGQTIPGGTGSYLAPPVAASVAKGQVKTAGGKVTRGGFGSKSGSVGG